MVLGYYDALPRRSSYAWVPPGHVDPWVDSTARRTYDHAYEGTGNWPFNTAYAATYHDMEGIVTRLHSLTELELFIRAGIPVVTSQSFLAEELDGAGYGTNGHLMTIVGFTRAGDVVVNDPASHLVRSDDQVRTTYPRQQFSNAWFGHTGGIACVVHPESVRLPRPTRLQRAEPSW